MSITITKTAGIPIRRDGQQSITVALGGIGGGGSYGDTEGSVNVTSHASLSSLTYATAGHTGFAPSASPTFTGTVTIPTPFTLGAVSVTTTGTQLNYLNTSTGVTGTAKVVLSASPTFTGTVGAAAITATGIITSSAFRVASGTTLSYFNGGNVGFGIEVPTVPVHIKSSTNTLLTVESTDTICRIRISDAVDDFYITSWSGIMALGNSTTLANNAIFILDDDNVGIKTTTPGGAFCVNGGVHIGGDTDAGDDNLWIDGFVGSEDWVSETTGWHGTYAGAFDFRSVFTNELICKTFIADIDLALLSGTMVSKSITQVSRDFVIPAVNATGTLYVEAIPGFPTSQCFEDNDYIRLQVINRTGGGLIWVSAYGTVASFVNDGAGEQHYTFTTKYAGATGAAEGETVYAGAGAQDLGISGNGYIQSEAGSHSLYTPYIQTVTWTTNPWAGGNLEVRTRMGNLTGVTNQTGFGLVTRKDSNNYVTQWWNTSDDWGLRGVVGSEEMFSLGDVNQIAGWTFTQELLYKEITANRILRINASDASYTVGFQFYRHNPDMSDGDVKIVQMGQLYTAGNAITGGTDYGFQIKTYHTSGDTYRDIVYLGADARTIAGWNIDSTTISKNNATLSSTGVLTLGTGDDVAIISAVDATYRVWIGDATAADAPFSVAKNGDVSIGSASTLQMKAVTGTGIGISGLDIYEGLYNGDGTAYGTVHINKKGYLGGLTKYRNTIIGDGKFANILKTTGSTKLTELFGSLYVTGGCRLDDDVAIGGTGGADTSAALDIRGPKALIIPRMDEDARDDIDTAGAVNGMLIYNTDTTYINMYVGGAWQKVAIG